MTKESEVNQAFTDVAQVIARYYNQLVEHGMPKDAALDLTKDFQHYMSERGVKAAEAKAGLQNRAERRRGQ